MSVHGCFVTFISMKVSTAPEPILNKLPCLDNLVRRACLQSRNFKEIRSTEYWCVFVGSLGNMLKRVDTTQLSVLSLSEPARYLDKGSLNIFSGVLCHFFSKPAPSSIFGSLKNCAFSTRFLFQLSSSLAALFEVFSFSRSSIQICLHGSRSFWRKL